MERDTDRERFRFRARVVKVAGTGLKDEVAIVLSMKNADLVAKLLKQLEGRCYEIRFYRY